MGKFIVYFSIGVVVGYFAWFFIYRKNNRVAEDSKNKEILNFIEKNRKITNDDVQEILEVSDSTATRYLQNLVDEGELEQHGETGKYVYYTRKF